MEKMEQELRLIDGVDERTHSWVVEIDDKLSKMESSPQPKPRINEKKAICRRPVNAREEKGTFLYTPRIVSFGPYHHDSISCKETNEYKKDVLVPCLKRSGKKLSDYLKALREVVQELKDAYNELDQRWQQDDHAFSQLMIYDGCFFLEILHEALEETNHLGHLSHQTLAKYRISWEELMEYYKHDVLLLENQLPMQLLVKLVSVQNDLSMEAAKEHLYKRILRFVAPVSSPNIAEKLLKDEPKQMYLHVLDLYRHSLICEECEGENILQASEPASEPTPEQVTLDSSPNSNDRNFLLSAACYCRKFLLCATYCCIFIILIPFMFIVELPIILIFIVTIILVLGIIIGPLAIRYLIRSRQPKDIDFVMIPSVIELDKVGIAFQMNKTRSLMSISYGSRTLSLPEIYVDGSIQSRFLNIIAFEQLHADAKSEVTSYIYFMSRLLQTEGDVRLLQVRGIIHTVLHNNQVVELFKSLTKDIVHDPNFSSVQNYREVGKRLTKSFHGKMNNPWQRDLWQTYLKSPWAVISVVAAFILFFLTLIQTVYAVASYNHDK